LTSKAGVVPGIHSISHKPFDYLPFDPSAITLPRAISKRFVQTNNKVGNPLAPNQNPNKTAEGLKARNTASNNPSNQK
jgi:hypothetical protein